MRERIRVIRNIKYRALLKDAGQSYLIAFIGQIKHDDISRIRFHYIWANGLLKSMFKTILFGVKEEDYDNPYE